MKARLKLDDLPLDVRRLVFTSDEDLRSSLRFQHHLNLDVLTVAHEWCAEREGYKTKAGMLAAAMKRIAKPVAGGAR